LNGKYVIIVPDGAAGEPIEKFDGRTVLEAADIPNIDKISSQGRRGMVRTIPRGMPAGSDVAMMSVIGYDPRRYYTGRAPIEAVARDIELSADDWVFRCNLVTIADGKMADHSAGHISSEEAAKLMKELNEVLGNEQIHFYPGVSYRNLLVMRGVEFDVHTQPPHDIIGSSVEKNLPRGKYAQLLIDIMARAQQVLSEHEINRVRRDLGENPVSSIWLWGEGKKAGMESFKKRFGLTGAAITAVDLVRGLSKLVGFDVISVPGATGFVDTNYEGKGREAIKALEKYDLVLVHIEAPDEAGHSGNPELKRKAVERIDKYIVGPVLEALQNYEGWRILVMPDHPTFTSSQAHSPEPVPFAIAGEKVTGALQKPFNEVTAAESGLQIENGFELMEYFLRC
jgi:2,3-bisphosphoglycerate-independent phosphoglycerate mutase